MKLTLTAFKNNNLSIILSLIVSLLCFNGCQSIVNSEEYQELATNHSSENTPAKAISKKDEYTVAAYYWPSMHDDPLWRPFFQGDTIGEWKVIKNAKPKFEGHYQPRVPLWGYEMEDHPKVMAKKIDAAVSHGVNCFIFDWYWYDNKPFLEGAINNGFLKANNVDDIDFYLMWANHDIANFWDITISHLKRHSLKPGFVDFETFKVIVDRVISKYMMHPSYYKIDGAPVFSIFHLSNFVKGMGSIKEARNALDYFDQEAIKAGFPGIHFQAIYRSRYTYEIGKNAPFYVLNDKNIEELGIDSTTPYQYTMLSKPVDNYRDWADKALAICSNIEANTKVPFFPHVSIGWDNNPRFVQSVVKPVVKENVNPAVFKEYLLRVKDYADAHPKQPKLITINSWNEWVEGSYLEPDERFGYGYLEAVKAIFKPLDN